MDHRLTVPEFILSVPEFIPDDVASPHLDEARRRVASSTGASQENTSRPAAGGSAPRPATGDRHRRRPPHGRARGPVGRGSRPHRASRLPAHVGLIAAATVLGVLGLLALSVLWTWLAVTSDAGLWIPFAVGGWIATAAVPGVVVGWWWDRSGDQTTPWFHPRGDVRRDPPWHGGG